MRSTTGVLFRVGPCVGGETKSFMQVFFRFLLPESFPFLLGPLNLSPRGGCCRPWPTGRFECFILGSVDWLVPVVVGGMFLGCFALEHVDWLVTVVVGGMFLRCFILKRVDRAVAILIGGMFLGCFVLEFFDWLVEFLVVRKFLGIFVLELVSWLLVFGATDIFLEGLSLEPASGLALLLLGVCFCFALRTWLVLVGEVLL